MDDENKKLRKAAKRELNDNIREIVAFVRKRDKRVAAHQVILISRIILRSSFKPETKVHV